MRNDRRDSREGNGGGDLGGRGVPEARDFAGGLLSLAPGVRATDRPSFAGPSVRPQALRNAPRSVLRPANAVDSQSSLPSAPVPGAYSGVRPGLRDPGLSRPGCARPGLGPHQGESPVMERPEVNARAVAEAREKHPDKF